MIKRIKTFRDNGEDITNTLSRQRRWQIRNPKKHKELQRKVRTTEKHKKYHREYMRKFMAKIRLKNL